MALPPPLPAPRARLGGPGGPPLLPSQRGTTANPYAVGSQFDPNRVGNRVSTRDVKRVSGSIYGVDFFPNSTNVNRMRCDRDVDANGEPLNKGTITIEFLSGATYKYADRPITDWMDLVESSSKGRFTYFEVRGPGKSRKGMGIWSGVMVRPAFRSKSEVADMRRKREPVTAEQRKRTYTRGGRRGAYGAGGVRIR